MEGSNVKKFNCDVCHKKFATKTNLNKHIVVHSQRNPHECHVCKKKFTTRYYFNIHVAMHSGEKPHECELCNEKFTTKYYLNTHVAMHSGRNPYECELCEKKFKTKYYRNIHTAKHSGQNPYECELCREKFKSKYYLRIHMAMHIGEKRHVCDVCQMKFIMKHSLNSHMYIHNRGMSKKKFKMSSHFDRYIMDVYSEETSHEYDASRKCNNSEIKEEPLYYSQDSNHKTVMLLPKETDSTSNCDIDKLKKEPLGLYEDCIFEPKEEPFWYEDGNYDMTLVEEKADSLQKYDDEDGIEEEFKGFPDESSNFDQQLNNGSIKCEPILDYDELAKEFNLIPCLVSLRKIIIISHE